MTAKAPLLETLNGEQPSHRPVWLMRQAGRYMKAYQALRENYSFKQMVYLPEIAAEVTLQPVQAFGVDAAIIFSDILLVPEALGCRVDFIENRGPVFQKPIRTVDDIDRLPRWTDEAIFQPTAQAIRLVRKELPPGVPVIGFCGAPWTLAAYMIEGGSSRQFRHAKRFLYLEPEALHRLLARLTEAAIQFLRIQVQAGAQIVQIFESWADQLTPRQFHRFSLPYLQKIVQNLPGTPVILFARGAGHSLKQLAETGARAISVDWQTDLTRAKKLVGRQVVLQGNLDPAALYAPKQLLKTLTESILNLFPHGRGHIFNLGHGVFQDTPEDRVGYLVDLVHEFNGGH